MQKMNQQKNPPSRKIKRKLLSTAAVLLAVIQLSAVSAATVTPTFGDIQLTNLVATTLMRDYSRTVAPGLVETKFTFTNRSNKINECFMLEYAPSAGCHGAGPGKRGHCPRQARGGRHQRRHVQHEHQSALGRRGERRRGAAGDGLLPGLPLELLRDQKRRDPGYRF